MFERKRAKKRARINIKKHYVIFVLTCLLAAFVGASFTSSLSSAEKSSSDVFKESLGIKTLTTEGVLNDLMSGEYEKGLESSNLELESSIDKGYSIGALELGRAKGVLSGVVNNISSGKYLIIVFQTIMTITNSKSIATDVFIVLAALVMLSVTIFIKSTYKVAYRRIFLEGYLYDNVKVNRILYLFKVKKFFKVAKTIFITDLYQLLWDLTIVGGIIKKYSYYMVPYIVAENPDISTHEAIDLSRRMMYGHKFECFKLEISFIGYWILGAITMGISQILYSNPYEEATYCTYYVYLRKLAKENGISYVDRLNDEYLYTFANKKDIDVAYSDVIEIMYDDIDVRNLRHKGLRGFIENNFGIIYKYDEQEDMYNIAIEQEEKISEYQDIITLGQYPNRLSILAEKNKDFRVEHVHYLRHYSIWTVIALFFIFCFIGWSWEVLLHLIVDGEFVNRGVNHGPWLPIYGTGGVMILVLLFRFRNKPGLEAFLAISLCGIVEYFTHWLLEVTKGTKWWDYSGYFLNLNGRICAEGLLVFMLGGLAIVYALAPMLDNLLRKVKQKTLKIICIILLIIFSLDVIYSSFNPNMGEGITDYDNTTVVEKIDIC